MFRGSPSKDPSILLYFTEKGISFKDELIAVGPPPTLGVEFFSHRAETVDMWVVGVAPEASGCH